MATESPDSLTHPLSDHQPSDPTAIPTELASLNDLAVRGSWRSILDEVGRARTQSLLLRPHDNLTCVAFSAMALAKLRRFADADAELDSLGDLDSPRYRYESHPEIYLNRTGSMVPFSLRWLQSILPIKLAKRQEGLDRLYCLLDFVRDKVREKCDLSDSLRVWKRREVFVTNSIIGVHLSNKEFTVCLSLIKDSMSRGYADPILLSKLGYIQMQIGDLEAAKRSFNRVESKKDWEQNQDEADKLTEVEFANLVDRNKALTYLVAKDYVSAVREYDLCIERDDADFVAINNKALCLMYLRDLADSIKVIEGALERVPTAALNETLVVNLCSMYELAYVNHSDIKKTLNSWIARVAPDDFDSSCTRS